MTQKIHKEAKIGSRCKLYRECFMVKQFPLYIAIDVTFFLRQTTGTNGRTQDPNLNVYA